MNTPTPPAMTPEQRAVEAIVVPQNNSKPMALPSLKAAVLAERESILAEVDDIRARYAPIGSKEWRLLGRVRAAIRSRGVPG